MLEPPPDTTGSDTTGSDDIVVLHVAGEIDVLTIAVLQGGLDDGLARGPCHLVVDLSQVTFCGVHGVGILVRACEFAAAQGVGLTVSGASRRVVWMWATGWPGAPLPAFHRDAAAAVRAVRSPGRSRHGEPEPARPRQVPLPPPVAVS